MPQDAGAPESAHVTFASSRTISIPLMSKKMNSVERYINSYKSFHKNIQLSHLKNCESRFADNAERLLYGGLVTPDPHELLLKEGKCYVSYSPLKEQKTEEKLQMLNKLEDQYSSMKNNLSNLKQPYTSKYTIPIHKRKVKNEEEEKGKQNSPYDSIENQLRREILIENGKRHYLDLYMMNRDRAEIKDDIQKKHKYVREQQMKDKYKEHEKFLIQKRQKQTEQKRHKMIKNKGPHLNVYCEMLALSRVEKERLKEGNSSFMAAYSPK